MKSAIYYFSGTGNSLVVARDIASKISECDVIPISKAINGGIEKVDSLGIVFPVYMWGPPLIIKEFVKKLRPQNAKYFFAVTTYGGFPANTLGIIEKMMADQGIKLSSGFGVRMPGNYTPMYGAKPVEKQKEMFKNWNERIDKIVYTINSKVTSKIEKNNPIVNFLFSKLLYASSAHQIKKMDESFCVNDKCNSCEICAKVCPVNNIKMQDGKPTWNHNCEQCLACLQWCPVEAIQFGKKTEGRKRYRHPDVSVSDLM